MEPYTLPTLKQNSTPTQKPSPKTHRKRPALATITQNWPTKKQETMKRSVSIANINRRLSLNSLQKKSDEVVQQLLKMPKKDKHLMTAQIKCFMMARHRHDSHLMDERLAALAVEKVRTSDRVDTGAGFDRLRFMLFCQSVFKKSGDSALLAASFEACMSEKYPPSIHMMLIYLGTFFYSINSQYDLAESYCQKLFDMIVKFKLQEYFIIYLILKIKLKTNLSEWEDALKLLTKLVFFAWMYNLVDLEIWCYFQFSRAYFFMQRNRESEIFKLKSENNAIEPKRSIYREVCISNLILEIEAIWEGQLDFKYRDVIEETRLTIPERNRYGVEEYIADQRKLKTNIKSIIEDCKIRHVGNLLSRIGEIGIHSMQKQSLNETTNAFSANCSPTRSSHCLIFNSKYKNSLSSKFIGQNNGNNTSSDGNQKGCLNAKSGNNFLLTHKSFNKNMCMYFRKRATNEQNSQRVFYTIENSQKNWGVLKQMLRNIYIQMNYFSNANSNLNSNSNDK